jgi:hypothetical protein
MPTLSETSAIERARGERRTGFIVLSQGGTPYFVEGQEVSKEEFVLRSDMDHLLDDSSTVKCSKCGRESVLKYYRTQCGMPQPSRQNRDGVFY